MRSLGPIRNPLGCGLGFALLAILTSPDAASAHLVSTGLGPYFDGIGHLAVTLEDLLPVVAMALLAGMGGKAYARRVLWVLPVAWLVGGLLGLALGWGPPLVLTSVSFLVFGGLVAADKPFELRTGTWLASALGLVHGLMNGAELGVAGLGVTGLMGVLTVLVVTVSLLTAMVISLEKPWTRIAVRVAGSWVVASGLLYLGWSLRA